MLYKFSQCDRIPYPRFRRGERLIVLFKYLHMHRREKGSLSALFIGFLVCSRPRAVGWESELPPNTFDLTGGFNFPFPDSIHTPTGLVVNYRQMYVCATTSYRSCTMLNLRQCRCCCYTGFLTRNTNFDVQTLDFDHEPRIYSISFIIFIPLLLHIRIVRFSQ